MRYVTLLLLAALLSAQTSNRELPARVIVLQLTSLGLQPESLLLEPGRYIIRFRNGLFTRPVQLRVEDERSTTLRSVSTAAGAGRTDFDFSFALGKHAIVVDGNSKLFWLSGKMRTENWWKREDSALRAGIFKA
jgi:hypothetical protein